MAIKPTTTDLKSELTTAFTALLGVVKRLCSSCKHLKTCGLAYGGAPGCVFMTFKNATNMTPDEMDRAMNVVLKYQVKVKS